MEGDIVEDVFGYISTGEIVNGTLVNIEIGNWVRDAYNRSQINLFVSLRRLRECIHVMQMRITQDREHKPASETKQGDYLDISVAYNRYKVGIEVCISIEGVWRDANSGVLVGSGTVTSCARERYDSLNYVTLYALFDKFKAYGPKVVVKEISNSFWICGDKT